MNILNDIDKSNITPEKFTVVIEIPAGGRMKYELDKETGFLKLDRVLKTAMVYPANYGFIPRTLGGDGDPLDVLVLMPEPLQPLCLVDCVPLGVIEMIDNGERDEKLLVVPTFSKMTEVPEDKINEIKHFMSAYKALEKKNKIEVGAVHGKSEAVKIITAGIASYEKEIKGAKKK
jgi:inorganic pyrophosphatase